MGGRFLIDGPMALAHRGGAKWEPNLGIENSLRAMRNAVDLGYRYIETDVRICADGAVFCFHDAELDRLVGHPGRFEDLSSADVRALELVGGQPIPTLAEVLEEMPAIKFNIDVKCDVALEPTLKVLDRAGAYDRVMLGSFNHRRLRRLRRLRSDAATSTSTPEALSMWWGMQWAYASGYRSGALAMQVPPTYRGREVITPQVVAKAHARNLQVHVWTIDDAASMHDLLDKGVDGIITDRPDVLRDVLIARGQWDLESHTPQYLLGE